MTATDCAIQCRQRTGCKYFIFFQRTVIEEHFNCYMENTTDSSCPEGWKDSKFDFYKLKGAYDSFEKIQTATFLEYLTLI